jgi:glycine/D-amino acid oxidase-like deaminating enzyme
MKPARDVIVVGGGPAGTAAAVAAARNGVSVLLVEKTGCLGGMLTGGMVGMIRTAGDRGGIVREFWERLACDGNAVIEDGEYWTDPRARVWLDAFAARVELLNLVEESGAELLLETHLAGIESSEGRVSGIRIVNKDGMQALKCRMVVDASGDGDVAAWAGVPFDKGREEDGFLQAVSLNFRLAGVDEGSLPAWSEFHAACRGALEDGTIAVAGPARVVNLGCAIEHMPRGIRHFQFDLAHGVDASEATSLSAGDVLCQRRVHAIWQFLRNRFPAFSESRVVEVASQLGVRESRRIHGLATLTEDTVLGAVKHPDGVSKCCWYMDLHDGQDKHPLDEYRASRRPPVGDYYEVPYGCMVPQGMDGLLVAGRCISSTRPANGSVRLQPTCMNLGQAAGTAAALCCQRNIEPSDLDGVELRRILTEQGADL